MKAKRTPTVMVPFMTALPPNQSTRKLPMALNAVTSGMNADMVLLAVTLACMLETFTSWNSWRLSCSRE